MNTDFVPTIPSASLGIEKGVPLKLLLGKILVEHLAANLKYAWAGFEADAFISATCQGLDELELFQRSEHIAISMRAFLPDEYEKALDVILKSLPPRQETVGDLGKERYYFLPLGYFVSHYGLDSENNNGNDPFEVSTKALYELTMRFTSEFAIRDFFLQEEERMMQKIKEWISDPNPHVRRLCCEGTRPILPWGKRLPRFLEDPAHTKFILEALKDDEELYVRRSVANHLGDLAKKHPEWVFSLCEKWTKDATKERKWLIRHAVRYWAKKEHPRALAIRLMAK